MKRVLTFALSLMVLFALAACGGDSSGLPSYSATLSGDNEQPDPVTTEASGEATATLDGSTLSVEGTFEGLESDLTEIAGTSAHIHQVENADGTGGVIFGLTVTSADSRSGSFEGSGDLTDAQIDLLNDGDLYVNIHTEDNPAGELRGDLTSD